MRFLLLLNENLQLLNPQLHLLDCPLAAGDRRRLNLFHTNSQAADLCLQCLAGSFRLENLGLFLTKESFAVLCVVAGLVGTVIGQLELAGDVGVVGADGGQFLLDLGDLLCEVDIDVGDFGQAVGDLNDLGLGDLLGVERLFEGGAVLVGFLLKDLELVCGSGVLVKSAL